MEPNTKRKVLIGAIFALIIVLAPALPLVASLLPFLLAVARFSVRMVVVPGEGGEYPDSPEWPESQSAGELAQEMTADLDDFSGAMLNNYNTTVVDLTSGWNAIVSSSFDFIYSFWFNYMLGIIVVGSIGLCGGLIVSFSMSMGTKGFWISAAGSAVYAVALVYGVIDIQAGLSVPYMVWAVIFLPTAALKRTPFWIFFSVGAFIGLVFWVQLVPDSFTWMRLSFVDFDFLYLGDPPIRVGFGAPATVATAPVAILTVLTVCAFALPAVTDTPGLPILPQTAEDWTGMFEYSWLNFLAFVAKATITFVGIIATLTLVIVAVRYKQNGSNFGVIASAVAIVGMWLVLYGTWRLLARGIPWHVVVALSVFLGFTYYAKSDPEGGKRSPKQRRAIYTTGAGLSWFLLLSLVVAMTFLPMYTPWVGGWPRTAIW